MSQFTKVRRSFISNFKIINDVTKARRDLILSILRSTTTKREAKTFLNKYQDQFEGKNSSRFSVKQRNGILHETKPTQRLIEQYLGSVDTRCSKFFDIAKINSCSPLRVAVVNISHSCTSSRDIAGIAETLKRLVELGVSPVVVWDQDENVKLPFRLKSLYLSERADKLSRLLLEKTDLGHGSIQTTLLRSLFTKKAKMFTVDNLEQVLVPMYQGILPIVLPVAFGAADGSQTFIKPKESSYQICSKFSNLPQSVLTLEKIVYIDPRGGIPSAERDQASHVFINLSQEYADVISELHIGHLSPIKRDAHIANLESMCNALNHVAKISNTKTTTGIITPPSALRVKNDQLNPVIYNVLTDRPIISSSLPSGLRSTPQISTSIVKKGYDVTVLDEYSYHRKFNVQNLTEDKLVDKEKLFLLIEDSFGKSLKRNEYMKRIEESLAAVIIVGDYDGAAIITWETLRNGEKIAYLDKFAIAKRNQGIPGLADIIFKLIIQFHPKELLWRSKVNNPVNKWYFQRCQGSATIPMSPWKLFYAGEIFGHRLGTQFDGSQEGSIDITEKLRFYTELCHKISPSF